MPSNGRRCARRESARTSYPRSARGCGEYWPKCPTSARRTGPLVATPPARITAIRTRRKESARALSGFAVRRRAPRRPPDGMRRSYPAGRPAGRAGSQRPLSRVTRDRSKTPPVAGPIVVGHEYAISVAANPSAEQSAHRPPANPSRRRTVSLPRRGRFSTRRKGARRRPAGGPTAGHLTRALRSGPPGNSGSVFMSQNLPARRAL
jgi:hypothetical protein